MVSADEHGYKTVNYSDLPYLLLGEIQRASRTTGSRRCRKR